MLNQIFSSKKNIPHSTQFSGGVCPHSSKAARGEDLQVEHPVWCGYSSTFHFYPTLPSMLGSALIRKQVRQARKPRQKCPWAPLWRCHDPSEYKKNGC